MWRPTIAKPFWEQALHTLTSEQWEALCDQCGRCCMVRLHDEETQEIAQTCVACDLYASDTGLCTRYMTRQRYVPECVVITPENIAEIAHWMPYTCAYRRVFEGRGLASWHPLVSGDPGSVDAQGVGMRGRSLPQKVVPEAAFSQYIVDVESN